MCGGDGSLPLAYWGVIHAYSLEGGGVVPPSVVRDGCVFQFGVETVLAPPVRKE